MLATALISQVQQRFSHEKRAQVSGPLMFKEMKPSAIRLVREIRSHTSSTKFFTADYADTADV
jgi:hypothetical protein